MLVIGKPISTSKCPFSARFAIVNRHQLSSSQSRLQAETKVRPLPRSQVPVIEGLRLMTKWLKMSHSLTGLAKVSRCSILLQLKKIHA